MSDSLWPHGLQHARLPCPPLSPGICSNSCPLSWWYHPTISSSDHCKDGFLAAGRIFTKRYSQGSHFAIGCLCWVVFEKLSQNIIFHLKFHFLHLHMIFRCFLNKRLWLSAELEVELLSFSSFKIIIPLSSACCCSWEVGFKQSLQVTCPGSKYF